MDLEGIAQVLSHVRPRERLFAVWTVLVILLVWILVKDAPPGMPPLCEQRLGRDLYWPLAAIVWGWIPVAVVTIFGNAVAAGWVYFQRSLSEPEVVPEAVAIEPKPPPPPLAGA